METAADDAVQQGKLVAGLVRRRGSERLSVRPGAGWEAAHTVRVLLQ